MTTSDTPWVTLHVIHHLSQLKFFVLNLVGWFGVLSNKFIIFWYSIIMLLFQSQIIKTFLSLFWRYISFFRYFFIILIFNCFWMILLWIFLIPCNFIRNFITNQITSCFCYFLNCFFEEVLNTSVPHCLAWSKTFWLYLPLKFLLIFLPTFLTIFFSKRQKSIAFHKCLISRLNYRLIIPKWGAFSPFSSLVILLFVLPSNFMVLCVKISR